MKVSATAGCAEAADLSVEELSLVVELDGAELATALDAGLF
ncbi:MULTISPECIES: hypothetical protein [Limosilactobacillus]|nr:hypothetical protein [Limosilactobacillus reuteri]